MNWSVPRNGTRHHLHPKNCTRSVKRENAGELPVKNERKGGPVGELSQKNGPSAIFPKWKRCL